MEKKTPIRQKDHGITSGFYIDVNCCICGCEKNFGASSKKDLIDKLKEEGWSDLDSDIYGTVGYYCGCDYKPYTD